MGHLYHGYVSHNQRVYIIYRYRYYVYPADLLPLYSPYQVCTLHPTLGRGALAFALKVFPGGWGFEWISAEIWDPTGFYWLFD